MFAESLELAEGLVELRIFICDVVEILCGLLEVLHRDRGFGGDRFDNFEHFSRSLAQIWITFACKGLAVARAAMNVTTGARTMDFTGLTTGVPYTFVVTATNDVGVGPASDPSNSVTPSNCGNGIVDPGEECDDGNGVSGDGCDPNCAFSRGLHVRVETSGGSPIADADVVLIDSDGTRFSAVSGSDGVAFLTGVPDGQYTVFVTAKAGAKRVETHWSFTVDSGAKPEAKPASAQPGKKSGAPPGVVGS